MKTSDTPNAVLSLCVIDCSGSMIENDYPPTRLEAAKSACLELVQVTAKQRPNDLVGIIGFDSDADLVVPLTPVTNTHAFHAGIQPLQPGYTTDFANALELASQVFAAQPNSAQPRSNFLRRQQPKHNRRIIFLSNGHHNGRGTPLSAVSMLKSSGIVIECLGIGGTPQDVDERLMKLIASTGPNGKPMYRFINDRKALLQEFRKKALLKVIDD